MMGIPGLCGLTACSHAVPYQSTTVNRLTIYYPPVRVDDQSPLPPKKPRTAAAQRVSKILPPHLQVRGAHEYWRR